MQPLVEPDRNNNNDTFKSMISAKNGKYMKRTIDLIIRWERTDNTSEICHIHGNNDHTVPLRNVVNPDYIVEGGSHMMTLTKGGDISLILKKVLD